MNHDLVSWQKEKSGTWSFFFFFRDHAACSHLGLGGQNGNPKKIQLFYDTCGSNSLVVHVILHELCEFHWIGDCELLIFTHLCCVHFTPTSDLIGISCDPLLLFIMAITPCVKLDQVIRSRFNCYITLYLYQIWTYLPFLESWLGQFSVINYSRLMIPNPGSPLINIIEKYWCPGSIVLPCIV